MWLFCLLKNICHESQHQKTTFQVQSVQIGQSNASTFRDILKYVLSTKFNDIFFKKFLIQPHQGVIYHNEQFNCIKF